MGFGFTKRAVNVILTASLIFLQFVLFMQFVAKKFTVNNHQPRATINRVAIIDGARTPFAKAGTAFRQHSALDLAIHAVNGLLHKLDLDPAAVEELAYGVVIVDPRLSHLAREVVLASQLGPTTRAQTVTDNCISSATAAVAIADSIRSGRAEIGIAGGVESMSNPTLMFNRRATRVFLDARSAQSMPARVRGMLKLRPGDFAPAAPSVKEPSTGLSMGEHCELMVKEWGISREAQDEIALRSHQRAHAATVDGRLANEIVELDGINHDLTVRPNTSLEKLSSLPSVFDRSPTGTITAGNASPLTDGASALLLMSEAWANREGVEPLAFLRAVEYAGVDPCDGLLMAPALAVPRLLRKTGVSLDEIGIVEMHEAFAGQVACNLKAWREGWREPAVGEVDPARLNPLGSSLAVGHPFGATGARILTTLAHEMARREVRYGLVSICGAGATGVAMLLERD